MQIWNKGFNVNNSIIDFTVGNDHILDMNLIKYDCIASIAHAKMLKKIKLLTEKEMNSIIATLNEIIKKVNNDQFTITREQEDCHTAIEGYLIQKLGEVGKKIHTGRSRNDQVLIALRLFEIEELSNIEQKINLAITQLNSVGEKHKDVPLPGYTHMRKAMPTSIKTWIESFADSLKDDLKSIHYVKDLIDQSPLGTAAGFGVPVFELDRDLTRSELGFKTNIENPMYAQITRGKFEGNIINSCSQVMLTLNKLATDIILFSMTEFNFIKLPKEICTGSSIMPQKMNPDVLEIIRAKYNEILGEEFKVKSTIGNLMSGYNRDVQITKESIIKSLSITTNSLEIITDFINKIEFNESNCKEAMTPELYATEHVNKLVKEGKSFRQAYKLIANYYIQ